MNRVPVVDADVEVHLFGHFDSLATLLQGAWEHTVEDWRSDDAACMIKGVYVL